MVNNYFAAYKDYFWIWENNQQVVSIPSRSTIAYKQHVSDLLKSMQNQNIPNFGTLVLCLVALNKNPESDLLFVFNVVRNYDISKFYVDFDDAEKFLNTLSILPEEYKSDWRKKKLLSTILNETHNGISQLDALKIYKSSLEQIKENRENEITPKIIHYHIRPLALLRRKFPTSRSIIEFLASVPEMSEEFEIQSVDTAEKPDLVDQLLDNYETAKIGALIKRFWSALNIPFKSVVPSDQSLGGVADISNKGNYDQLLISEYANDDITFLSRLANNEALFLKKESPPSDNEFKRTLLIDISIKNWGIPKILSFAAAIAISKHPKSAIECEIFLIGKQSHPVKIDSIHEIISALRHVDSSLSFSEGLQSFFEANPSSQTEEVFVLSQTELFEEQEVFASLEEHRAQINYWILANSRGEIDVYKNLQKSRKHVQHIDLPLDKLWKKTTKKHKSIPQIKGNTFYPLLVKRPVSTFGLRITETGELFTISKNKTLMRLYSKVDSNQRKGWEILYTKLDIKEPDWEILHTKNGEFFLLTFFKQSREITILNLKENTSISVPFKKWTYRGKQSFIAMDGVFYWGSNKYGYQIDTEGKINAYQKDYTALYKSNLKVQKEFEDKHGVRQGIFKNIHTVTINASGNIGLNRNSLFLDRGTHYKIVATAVQLNPQANAARHGNIFQFSDGSTIEINLDGILILTSSSQSIGPIYISSYMQGTLGLFCDNHFAGNNYFYKEALYEIKLLENSTISKIALVKQVKIATGVGLKQSKEIVDELPQVLPKRFTKKELDQCMQELETLNVSAEVIPVGEEQSTKEIKADLFKERYLSVFINTILGI